MASHFACACIWSNSWQCRHLSQDGFQREVSERLAGHIVGWRLLPSSGLSLILLAVGSLSVSLCSLSGPPVVR